jgi:hypothetical protein
MHPLLETFCLFNTSFFRYFHVIGVSACRSTIFTYFPLKPPKIAYDRDLYIAPIVLVYFPARSVMLTRSSVAHSDSQPHSDRPNLPIQQVSPHLRFKQHLKSRLWTEKRSSKFRSSRPQRYFQLRSMKIDTTYTIQLFPYPSAFYFAASCRAIFSRFRSCTRPQSIKRKRRSKIDFQYYCRTNLKYLLSFFSMLWFVSHSPNNPYMEIRCKLAIWPRVPGSYLIIWYLIFTGFTWQNVSTKVKFSSFGFGISLSAMLSRMILFNTSSIFVRKNCLIFFFDPVRLRGRRVFRNHLLAARSWHI